MIETAEIGDDKEGFIAEIMNLLYEATYRLIDNAETDFQFPLNLEEVVDLEARAECFIYLISDIVCDILRVGRGSRFHANEIGEPKEGLVCEVVTADGVKYGQNLSPPQLARTLERLKIVLEIR
jgi:hypothetical protein